MSKLRLTLACQIYDRTIALMDGTVQVEGVELNYIPLVGYETFWRMLHHSEFDASELSTSGYLITLQRNPPPYIAIPVFPSRSFRHSTIYINTNSGIRTPKDLEGKRVGGGEYSQTAALWVRGMLQDEYGVDLTKVQWFRGGVEAPDPVERVELNVPPGIHVENIPPGKTLNGMLDAGELDATITPHPIPSAFQRGSPRIRRLFSNYYDVEKQYYEKTRLFPIMHLIAIKRSVYDADPWVAASLMKAFEAAKAQAYHRMEHSAAEASLPWLHWYLEQDFTFFGRDPFAYGVEPNRAELETLVRYSHEQGLTHHLAKVDEIFAKEATDMFIGAARFGQSVPAGPLRFIRR